MCTLILGRDLPAPGQILIAANRDESPARPSEPPRVLRESPLLAGGRDRVAGGTWLAIRGRASEGDAARPARAGAQGSPESARAGRGLGPAAVMLLNRPPIPGAPPGRRSRGLLVLDVAASDDPLAAAERAAASGDYGPCTLVFASLERCWLVAIPGEGPPRTAEIGPGWHAITHAELDDTREPRTAWLLERLAALAPRTAEQAFADLASLLAHHGDRASPPVCIHAGRMPTVSASMVLLSRERVDYRHANGRPCEVPFVDFSALLARRPAARPSPGR